MDRNIKELIREAEKQGWTDVTGNGHTKLRTPAGYMIVMPSTASDHRAVKNAVSRMRKYGFVWKGR